MLTMQQIKERQGTEQERITAVELMLWLAERKAEIRAAYTSFGSLRFVVSYVKDGNRYSFDHFVSAGPFVEGQDAIQLQLTRLVQLFEMQVDDK